MAMLRLHLIISGTVQGVFFRSFTQKTAQRLGLTGYARNLPDGTVEVVAEGEKEQLEKLIAFCRKGPDRAYVEEARVAWQKSSKEFTAFSVR
ncbi:TPA: acylphosphatase [Candidatus Woesearchaeota archaeon]|nr:acylphosphatase [Candidatus Woesearchaeota archaeon]HII68565.1 acylphosphatase [Candidatus Woesearchaeota archaeon]